MNNPRHIEPIATEPASDSQPAAAPSAHKARNRELIYAAVGLGTGFVVLPALIFMVGTILLGPYAGGQSIWQFFGAFYANLFHGSARTWFIALSPYLAIWVVRLSFKRIPFGLPKAPEPDGIEPPPAQADNKASRREPFIST
jgi:hypothetical protein